MAAKLFSNEQLNFFKFSTLALDEFPKVLRQIFITMWNTKLAVMSGFIPWDDSPKVRNMLLTYEGAKTRIPTTKSIDEWDCTALFQATIYGKTFGNLAKGSTLNDLYLKKIKLAPGCFHRSVQSLSGDDDETCALAIDQLRLLRNALCHSPKSEMTKTDFDNYVRLADEALSAVNIDTTFVARIGEMGEDDFPTEKVQQLRERRINELRAIENMEQRLASIERQTDNVEQELSTIKGQTERIENVEQKLSSVDENLEKLISNMSLEKNPSLPGNQCSMLIDL